MLGVPSVLFWVFYCYYHFLACKIFIFGTRTQGFISWQMPYPFPAEIPSWVTDVMVNYLSLEKPFLPEPSTVCYWITPARTEKIIETSGDALPCLSRLRTHGNRERAGGRKVSEIVLPGAHFSYTQHAREMWVSTVCVVTSESLLWWANSRSKCIALYVGLQEIMNNKSRCTNNVVDKCVKRYYSFHKWYRNAEKWMVPAIFYEVQKLIHKTTDRGWKIPGNEEGDRLAKECGVLQCCDIDITFN